MNHQQDKTRTLRTDGSPRPLLDDMFMVVAEAIATRSTCPDGARHGAVIVLDGHIVATGYGSPAAGVPPCQRCWLRESEKETGAKDWSTCPSVHAEANAVAMAAKFGHALWGARAYVTRDPCSQCLRLLHNAGVLEVAYKAPGSGRLVVVKIAGDKALRAPAERA